MPTAHRDGVDLHYIVRGSGAETVVFSHSYLLDHRHFEPQVEALAAHYRVVAFDHRDHGQSGKASAPYTLDDLVLDAVAVIEHAGAGPCHWVGLSTGGFVGMRLALRHRELLRSLVLMDTSAEPEPSFNRLKYEAMFVGLRLLGVGPLVGEVTRLLFSPKTLADPTRSGLVDRWNTALRGADPASIIRFGRAIFARASVVEPLRGVTVPTLVMVGAHDKATPPSKARTIAQTIAGARLVTIQDAGHICTEEQPEAVNAALLRFFSGL